MVRTYTTHIVDYGLDRCLVCRAEPSYASWVATPFFAVNPKEKDTWFVMSTHWTPVCWDCITDEAYEVFKQHMPEEWRKKVLVDNAHRYHTRPALLIVGQRADFQRAIEACRDAWEAMVAYIYVTSGAKA